ncbi:MAG: hypothetical protein P8K80_11550 [Phycisphaerales bacterium]|nr:hypothetical protein [Phycisphaerales bacterium]
MSTDCSTIRRICSLAMLLGVTAVAGCEHESSRERAEVSKQLREAQQQLTMSLNDESKLQKTIRSLRGINGGTKQQQASRDLMLASTELDIAGIKTNAMQQLETRMRHELSYINILVSNANALQQFIDQRQISPRDLGTDQLQQNRQALGTQLQNLDRQVDRMQEPISEMEQVNAEQAMRIRDLRRAAEALRQEQYELGPLDGFAVFQRSIAADREANAIELEMTNRQVVLDLESKPIQMKTMQVRDHIKGHIDEVEATHDGLQAMASLQASRSEAARGLQQRTDASINDAYKAFSEQDTGPLTADIQAISTLLESAAKHARSGGRNVTKDARNAAILLETRAQMDLLLLQSHRVRSLQERVEMLNRMAASSFLSNRDAYELQGRKARETSEQYRTMAIATGQSIEQTLRGVRGGEVDSIRTAVQQITVGLGAEPPAAPAAAPAPTAPAAPATPAPAPAAAADATPSGEGAATPQDLVASINGIVKSSSPMKTKIQELMRYTDLSSPEAKQAMQAQMRLLAAVNKLGDAMESKFGSKQSPMMNMLTMQMQLPTIDPSLVQQTSETTAKVPVTNAMSQTDDEYMIKTDLGWQIDIAKKLKSSPQMQQGMAMLPTVIKAMNTVTKKVLDGSITNGMGVDMALGQAMAPGGAPGRP